MQPVKIKTSSQPGQNSFRPGSVEHDELLFAISHNRTQWGGAIAYTIVNLGACVLYVVVLRIALLGTGSLPVERIVSISASVGMALFHLIMARLWARRIVEHHIEHCALTEGLGPSR